MLIKAWIFFIFYFFLVLVLLCFCCFGFLLFCLGLNRDSTVDLAKERTTIIEMYKVGSA